MSASSLVIKRTFPVGVSRLFSLWTREELLRRWFAPGEMAIPVAECDPREGGSYRIVMENAQGETYSPSGVYEKVVANELLVFSWKWADSALITKVTVEFRALTDHETELTLTHDGFPAEETRNLHEEGWTSCLDRLGRLCTSLPSGPLERRDEEDGMKFYYHPISTYCQKVLIALREKNLEFEPEVVMLMDPGARAAYREIYPMGKIPALVLEDGHLIPESSIIIEYLDGLAEPALIFGDATQSRQIRFKDRMFDLYLNDSVSTLLFQSMKPESERDPEKIETAEFRIATLYGFMDREFASQAYANGERFGMADCAAAPALYYAQKIAPFDRHEHICAYWERLASRPSIRQTVDEAEPHIRAFMAQDAAA